LKIFYTEHTKISNRNTLGVQLIVVDANSILQQALNDFCLQTLQDTTFVQKAFKQINQMKREFGKGFALVNVGEFSPALGEFIYPLTDGGEMLWLDEEGYPPR
jgi:hypothetical protein